MISVISYCVKGGERMDKPKGIMLRVPEGLHTRVVKEAGEQTAKTGQRVSINQLVIEILEAYFERKAKRG
jgi:predicted HicB family RNase H-like nuclease